jgi:hypothetical protein
MNLGTDFKFNHILRILLREYGYVSVKVKGKQENVLEINAKRAHMRTWYALSLH